MNTTTCPETEPQSQTNPSKSHASHASHREPPTLKILDSPSLASSTLNLKPETLNPPATRVGKIARLPAEIRDEVNELLRAGRTYGQVAAELEKLGHPGISERNVCNWKHGGFVDWLRHRQQAEARLALPKALDRCLRSGQIDHIQQNAALLAADHLMTIMGLFNPKAAVDLLHQKPELFPKYIAAIGSLARCSADLAKSFDLLQNREALIRDELEVTDLLNGSAHATSPPDDEADAPELPQPPADRVPSPATTPIIPAPITPILHHSPSAATPRFDPNSEIAPGFQIPELTVERTIAELANLLHNANNGSHRKATVTNGSHQKPSKAKHDE